MVESLPSAVAVQIHRYRRGEACATEDHVAAEEPLEIRVRGRAISITMRTPGHDEELAAGFLLTEGVIRGREEVLAIEPCQREDSGSVINALLAPDTSVDFKKLTRHVFASSSCGICGKATIESLACRFPAIQSRMVVSPQTLLQLPTKMRDAQPTFDQTGGLHAAALFSVDGELLVLREDVGRHNAVDKVIGCALLNGVPIDRSILLVSGRTSFEIMQKALAGRVPIVAAVSAPSSLACEMAAANGQTLVGFLRDDRMNIYAGAERVNGAAPQAVSL